VLTFKDKNKIYTVYVINYKAIKKLVVNGYVNNISDPLSGFYREACGVLYGFWGNNICTANLYSEFFLPGVRERSEITGGWHSHPDGYAYPSQIDDNSCFAFCRNPANKRRKFASLIINIDKRRNSYYFQPKIYLYFIENEEEKRITLHESTRKDEKYYIIRQIHNSAGIRTEDKDWLELNIQNGKIAYLKESII
jgi:hypothetical protein